MKNKQANKNLKEWELESTPNLTNIKIKLRSEALKNLHKNLSNTFVSLLEKHIKITLEIDLEKKEQRDITLDTLKESMQEKDFLGDVFDNGEIYLGIFFSNAFCSNYLSILNDKTYDEGISEPSQHYKQKKFLTEFDFYAMEKITKFFYDECSILFAKEELSFTHKDQKKIKTLKCNGNINCYVMPTHFKNTQENFYISFIVSKNLLDDLPKNKKRLLEYKKAAMKNIMLELNAVIFEKQFYLSYINQLEEGSLIQINNKDHVILKKGNNNLLSGELGFVIRQLAVKVGLKKETEQDIESI